MAFSPVEFLRKFDRLLTLEGTLREAVQRLSHDVAALDKRLTLLEVRDQVLIAEAKGAAAAAAGIMTTAAVSDLARRIGVLEERGRSPRLSREQRSESE